MPYYCPVFHWYPIPGAFSLCITSIFLKVSSISIGCSPLYVCLNVFHTSVLKCSVFHWWPPTSVPFCLSLAYSYCSNFNPHWVLYIKSLMLVFYALIPQKVTCSILKTLSAFVYFIHYCFQELSLHWVLTAVACVYVTCGFLLQ